MFPIPFLLPLLGAGAGALTNKSPLKGAAMGAGLGALGGMAAPMLGFGGATPGMTAATGATPGIAGPVAGMGGSASGAQPGLLGQIADFAKPIGSAASAAGAVSGLLGPAEEPMQAAPPMMQTGIGSQTLTDLAGQNPAFDQLQMAEQERARRRQNFGGGLL